MEVRRRDSVPLLRVSCLTLHSSGGRMISIQWKITIILLQCIGFIWSDVRYNWHHVYLMSDMPNATRIHQYPYPYTRLQFLSKCLLKCLHFETSSDLSLINFSLSLNSQISNFSERHNPQVFELLLYPLARLIIDHFIWKSVYPSSIRCQIYLEREVSLGVPRLLNVWRCTVYRFLNAGSDRPI